MLLATTTNTLPEACRNFTVSFPQCDEDSSTARCLNTYDVRPSRVENYLELLSHAPDVILLSFYECVGSVMRTGKFKLLIQSFARVTATFCIGFDLATPC